MKKKKLIIYIFLSILIIFVVLIFFRKIRAKKVQIGNNSTSQEIIDYILNVKSYEATIEVEIKKSNNISKYKIKQIYDIDKINSQEILEPSNIQGVKIIKEGKNLKIENTKLNLVSIFENYEYVSDNNLDLCTFLKEFKNNKNIKYEENEKEVIMKIIGEEKNKIQKTLYINKKDGIPIKMGIEDYNKNISVNILYNEVKVNS